MFPSLELDTNYATATPEEVPVLRSPVKLLLTGSLAQLGVLYSLTSL